MGLYWYPALILIDFRIAHRYDDKANMHRSTRTSAANDLALIKSQARAPAVQEFFDLYTWHGRVFVFWGLRPSADALSRGLGLGLGDPWVTQGSRKGHPSVTQGRPKGRLGSSAVFATRMKK